MLIFNILDLFHNFESTKVSLLRQYLCGKKPKIEIISTIYIEKKECQTIRKPKTNKRLGCSIVSDYL